MKRVSSILLILLIFGFLASCGSKETDGEDSVNNEDNIVRELDYIEFFDDIYDHENNQKFNGNDISFSRSQTPSRIDSPLKGKRFFFLGSSVTAGSSSGGVAMGEYIAKRNGAICSKEAISGTTLANKSPNSYVERIKNFDIDAKIDGFICQLSTNDMNAPRDFGDMAENDVKDIDSFDISKTFGAIEYIIAYAKQTWNCPVYFYTNSYFNNLNYKTMVDKMSDIARKWDIALIDLYNDEIFNDVSPTIYNLFMADTIHPRMAGYRHWWVPKFEQVILEEMGYTFKNISAENPYRAKIQNDAD